MQILAVASDNALIAAEPALASSPSLLHGWLPLTVQIITTTVLIIELGRRSRRWLFLWLPAAAVVGLAVALVVRWYISDQGITGDPAPITWWVWVTLTGSAVAALIFGWRESPWWRRGVSLLAIPLCALCAALALNLWVGYFPTVDYAWGRITGAPLAGQQDQVNTNGVGRPGDAPTKGTLVAVDIPDLASGFRHRQELVYLPPAWYASNPPPRLPVVMMIGGAFSSPEQWAGPGQAQEVIDDFAAAHGGYAPVLVMVDSSGAFSNDTECVNGRRGNAADHLTKDVVPYMISKFGTSPEASNWGTVGWSAGGTCALTLTVTHPELLTAFVDIDGQLGPNAGTKEQTIARLFGGDANAWAAFDPATAMAKQGHYDGVSAWFAVSEDTPLVYRDGTTDPGAADDRQPENSDGQPAIANYMCALASSHGIECAVVPASGKHDVVSTGSIFAAALPWLAGKLGTPGVPRISLPGAPQS